MAHHRSPHRVERRGAERKKEEVERRAERRGAERKTEEVVEPGVADIAAQLSRFVAGPHFEGFKRAIEALHFVRERPLMKFGRVLQLAGKWSLDELGELGLDEEVQLARTLSAIRALEFWDADGGDPLGAMYERAVLASSSKREFVLGPDGQDPALKLAGLGGNRKSPFTEALERSAHTTSATLQHPDRLKINLKGFEFVKAPFDAKRITVPFSLSEDGEVLLMTEQLATAPVDVKVTSLRGTDRGFLVTFTANDVIVDGRFHRRFERGYAVPRALVEYEGPLEFTNKVREIAGRRDSVLQHVRARILREWLPVRRFYPYSTDGLKPMKRAYLPSDPGFLDLKDYFPIPEISELVAEYTGEWWDNTGEIVALEQSGLSE